MTQFQFYDEMSSTDDWVQIRFSGICHLEICNLSENGADFLISPNNSGSNTYTIEHNSQRVWDLTDDAEASYIYVKSKVSGTAATFKMAGF